jgi:hypothetical protein
MVGGNKIHAMDEVLDAYFAAWNEVAADERRQLLLRCVEEDVELFDPSGRGEGIDGLVDRIERYQSRFPETTIVPTSGVDGHNDVVRYAWAILDREGRSILDGLDVVERTPTGRLRRIMLFHGPLPGEAARAR